jgi:hypothetical protein
VLIADRAIIRDIVIGFGAEERPDGVEFEKDLFEP